MHTILVVEDSETMQQIVAIALACDPFTLVSALSCADGLARAATAPPAAVIVDHTLDDGSGYDLAARLRGLPGLQAVPIVLLTSEQAPLDDNRAAAAGVTAHLQKPFECDDLLVRMRSLLGVVAPPPPKAAPSPVTASGTRPVRAASASATSPGAAPAAAPVAASVPPATLPPMSASSLPPAPTLPPMPAPAVPPAATLPPMSATSLPPAPTLPPTPVTLVAPTTPLPAPPSTPPVPAMPAPMNPLPPLPAPPSMPPVPAMPTARMPAVVGSVPPTATAAIVDTATTAASTLPRTTGGVQQLASGATLPTPGLGLPALAPATPAPPFVAPNIPGLPTLNIQLSAGADHRWLHDLLRDAAGQGASDIHVHAMGPMRMRRFGTLWTVPDSALPVETVRRALLSLLSDADRARFDAEGQVDFGLTLPGAGRFRVNVYRQQRGTDGVFRVVQREPPTMASLRLPASLARLTTFHQGIVLLTGPGASGKSSTMAALVRSINEGRSDHIITIEDPIEVLHPSVRCVVNQRQATRHTKSFSRALKAALREDPDVIVIGEMRDRETAQLALTAAETGHLVLATLHTQSAVATINRVVGEFPPAQQPNVRAMLSESLRAIVSQRLLPRKDGSGVIPAVELLVNTPAVANLIREQRTHQIRTAMQTGVALGMQTLDASLNELVAQGLVDVDVARRQADDPRSVGVPGTPPAALTGSTPSTPSTLPAPATPT
jgi:twitching motility protein PilT